MHLTVRPATADDRATLVRLLEAAHGGGYSATFDRDGPLRPDDTTPSAWPWHVT